ncbi:MAG TPA: VOC family protein [Xanthobacteraceae bacterium]|nr:VOC family protein [Xanthobacteraceae bacterium]
MTVLPAATTLGPATLRVADEGRAFAVYRDLIGLEVTGRENGRIALGAAGKSFLFLDVVPGTTPRPRHATGLYHVAILLPDRAALGQAITRLARANVKLGAADHNVSEAIYLWDADNNGLEIYRDRPRAEWQWKDGRVTMGNLPLDFEGIIADGNRKPAAAEVPAGTRVGHVHLQVGDIEAAGRFYCDVIGFERTAERPGALFVSAGGYHHHLGLNVWDSKNGPLPPKDAAGLEQFVIRLPDEKDIAAMRARIEAAGLPVENTDHGFIVRDPWQTAIRISPMHAGD